MMFAEVAVTGIDKTLVYQVPEFLNEFVVVGSGVIVPVGFRQVLGILVSFPTEIDFPLKKIKKVVSVFEGGAVLTPQQMAFSDWISSYYLYPTIRVLDMMIPASIKTKGKRRFTFVKQAGPDVKQKVAELVEYIESVNTCFYDDLVEEFGKNRLGSLISESKEKGFIDEDFLLPQPKIKYEKFAKLTGADCSAVRGDKQKRVVLYLEDKGQALVAELNRLFGNSPVKSLIEKELLSVTAKESRRLPYGGRIAMEKSFDASDVLNLTDSQKMVMDEAGGLLDSASFNTALLHGVTGSGKTEIYLRLAEKVVAGGGSVIMLVPEISLTMSVADKFAGRFGESVFIHHSGLSEGERLDEWRMIRKSDVAVVVGARSALFSPVKNLGLIIVDEEHDGSYKQASGLKYNARDLAVVRGKLSDALVLLGSATPSVESFYNAMQKRYHYFEMPARVDDKPMPVVNIVDMKKYKKGSILSDELIEAMQKRLDSGEQVLLFVNRRGFSSSIVCGDCGHLFQCKNCSISLTYHKYTNSLDCHYCGYRHRLSGSCPECKSTQVNEVGFGTEKLEAIVDEKFPGLKQVRMDSDTTRARFAHLDIIEQMEAGDTGLLIGTQMVTKGHHLPGVTLVGVVLADLTLGFPDFRAAERTLQLLVQVAGRAGRGDKPGEMIIQTFNPDHYSIGFAAEHDYKGFYDEEITYRQELGYPPFSRLAVINITGPNEDDVEKEAKLTAVRLQRKCNNGVGLLGPVEAPVKRVKKMYRWQIMLKSPDVIMLRSLLAGVECATAKVRVSVDFDPVNFS